MSVVAFRCPKCKNSISTATKQFIRVGSMVECRVCSVMFVVVSVSPPQLAFQDGEKGGSKFSSSLQSSGVTAQSSDADTFEIRIPQTIAWQPLVSQNLLKTLYEFMPAATFSLRFVATQEGIRFVAAFDPLPKVNQKTVEALFTSHYPGVQVVPYTYPTPRFPFYRHVAYLKQATGVPFYESLTPVTAYKTSDPLPLVTQTMASLLKDEALYYTVLCTPLMYTEEQVKGYLTTSMYKAGYRSGGGMYIPTKDAYLAALQLAGNVIGWSLDQFIIRNKKTLRYSEEATERYARKLSQRVGTVTVRVALETPHRDRNHVLMPLLASIIQCSGTGAVRLQDGVAESWTIASPRENDEKYAGILIERMEQQDPTLAGQYRLGLLPEELASLMHPPHAGFGQQRIVWATSVHSDILKKTDTSIPIGTLPDGTTQVFLNRPDRQYHCYVTGQTGMGKSTLLHNLIHQDIALGAGVGVLDPHGTLIRDILQQSIPPHRMDDVVLLDCADKEYPVPINPFRTPPGLDTETVFATVMWVMKSLYGDSWSNTRMETTIRDMLQLVLADPEATPLDIQEIVLNANYRRRLVRTLDEEDRLSRATYNFWTHFDQLSPSEQRIQTQPVLHRLSAFLGSPQLERMSCHPTTLDFRALMRERKIVLINLKGDSIASEVGSLGAMFLANFFLSSKSLGQPEDRTQPRFYLYVDETQLFVTSALPDMFAEARKFGLSLTFANQYIGQLDEETRDGINNNVGTKISFECSPDEARLTAKLYEPEVAQLDVTRLGKGKAAVRTRVNGQTLPAFIVRTLPPPPAYQNQLDIESIQVRSRQNLGLLSRVEVKDWIKKRYDAVGSSKPAADAGLQDFE